MMPMRFLSLWLLSVCAALLALPGSAQTAAKPNVPRPTPAAPRPPVSFYKEVLPIFRTACLGCHGGDQPAGGLSLASYADLMKGGKSGPPLVAGKGSDSRIVKLLLGTQQPKMPPGGPLKPADIERIRQWIDGGAKADTPVMERSGKKAATVKLAKARARGTPRRAVPHLPPRRNIPTAVTALAFSPDGKTLAVGTYQEVQIWDVAARKRERIWSRHAGIWRRDPAARPGFREGGLRGRRAYRCRLLPGAQSRRREIRLRQRGQEHSHLGVRDRQAAATPPRPLRRRLGAGL